MGSQIALQCALHGLTVKLMDADAGQLQRASASNRALLTRRVEKGSLSTEELTAALERIHTTRDLAVAAGETDFVIEAVVEQLEVKQQLFVELERVSPFDALLATNSSTFAISRIVSGLATPERCLNMHFFHPVLVMKLVEIMRGPETSDDAVEAAVQLAGRMDRVPVVINREIFGLIVNRILGAIKREAFALAEQGYASPEDIDKAVKLGLNHPMGPFELSDFSGLDIFYHASLAQYQETGDESFKPSRLLEEKVQAGELGRKTGKGFYTYPRE
jgi:3-hydroxybutyryl-CoA dehydrogenase